MSTRPTRKVLAETMVRELRRTVANAVLFNLQTANNLGVNPTDLQFVNFIEMFGPLTPGQLAQMSRLTTGGVTVVLDRMEKAGMIKREPNPKDRRSSLVSVAPKFISSARAAYAAMADATDKLLAQFTNDELEVVATFLRKANDTRP